MKYLLTLLLFSAALAQEVTTEGGAYTNISVEELAERLSQDGQFLFVNTHIPYEGEIEGTDAFIPFDQVEAYYGVLPKDKASEIIVYCRSGSMSQAASETLVALGYTNVKNVTGGMRAWSASGFELKDAFAGSGADGRVNLDAVSAKVGIPRNRFVTSSISGEPLRGEENAQLVLIEFSDVNCPYCARFHVETLPQLFRDFVDTGQLRYVYRDYVSVGGAVSQAAAETAECLREQLGDARYLELINGLYAVSGRKNAAQLLELAANDPLDNSALDTCVSEQRYAAEVAEDQAAALAIGARGTPAFVLGYTNDSGEVEGMMFQGALPFETFSTYVRAFLEANN